MNRPINIFDFDGTLTTETWPKFWVWVEKFGYMGEVRNDELELALARYRETHSGNDLVTFFGFFNDLLTSNNEKLSIKELMAGEKFIVYNPGVENFIQNTDTQNYIVSGGIKEFLENLQIAKYFAGIYGTELNHDVNGNITSISDIMTDDKKITAIQDILRKNNRNITDCRNVFFIGDGYSDANAMRYVHSNGGEAIFVHQPNENDALSEYNNAIFRKLNSEGIVDYCCIADYTKNSKLEILLNRNEIER